MVSLAGAGGLLDPVAGVVDEVGVVAGAAEHEVGPEAAGEEVVASTAVDGVRAAAAEELVVAAAAEERVVAAEADHIVGLGGAEDPVIPGQDVGEEAVIVLFLGQLQDRRGRPGEAGRLEHVPAAVALAYFGDGASGAAFRRRSKTPSRLVCQPPVL